jgi:hypothetical protein
MSAPSFTYSGNVYTAGTAGTVDFALTSTTGNPIPYLEPGHIHVYKSANQGTSWTELTRPAQWDFVTSGTVARLAAGIAAGEWVKVQRITPSSSAYVTFQPSSLLTADQLNDDTLFNTYLNQELYDQGNQSAAIAASAETAAAAATTAATTATSTANSALAASASATTTANNALSASASATTASNTALSQSSTALSNSASAVTTANTASTNAATALSQSAAAVTTANNSQTVANTASTNSTNAVNTANTAASNASTALSQSNTALSQSSTALSQSSTALSQSSTALTNSSSAVSTANTANTNATAALNAVAAAVQYVLVANVAAIPASPTNGYAIEVVDSTGIESFSPVTNRPAGFIGDLGLSIRMQYSTTGPTWNWLGYFANNPEDRYLKLSGGTLTGQLKADDSTSTAAPVYAFDGDTNTGIAHTGADELALVTGGTARLTIDGSGNVAVPGGLTKGGSNVVTVGDTGTVTSAMLADGTIVNADVNTSAAIAGTKISPDFGSQNVTTTGTATAAALIPTSSSVPTNGVYLPSSNNVAISSNSSERIRIGANGEIGLSGANYGTSGQVLTSAGSGAAPTWTTPSAGNTDKIEEGNSSAEVIDTGSDGRFVVTTEGSERLRVDSSGRLGLGNSTPGSFDSGANQLVVGSGTGNNGLTLYSGSSSSGNIYFADGTAGTAPYIGFIQYRHDDNSLRFGTSDNTRLTIDSSGRCGIGTTSPTSALHIDVASGEPLRFRSQTSGSNYFTHVNHAGGDLAYVGAGGGAALGSGTTSDYAIRANQGALLFGTNGNNERGRFDTSGRFLVGTSTALGPSTTSTGITLYPNDYSVFSSAGNEPITVNRNNDGAVVSCRRSGTSVGSISVTTTATAFNTSSDYRLKENVVPLTGAADRLNQLQVHRFNFIADPGKTVDGFIAHEAQAVVPECVTGEKDEVDDEGNPIYQGIDQSKLVPLLTAALQEALTKIETLEARLTAAGI